MPKQVVAVGYIKEEDGIFTAICVNLGTFGQGKTPEAAVRKLHKSTTYYLDYVSEEHPDNWEKYLNRPAPPDLLKEFMAGLEQLAKLSKPKSRLATTRKPFVPVRSFAESISVAQT